MEIQKDIMLKANLERLTIQNTHYRNVIHTNKCQQIVLMNLRAHEEIGNEVHPHTSQFIRVELGTGSATIGDKTYRLRDGDFVVVPPGHWHNITAGPKGLKLYTIYSPPEHPEGLRQRKKPH